MLCEWYIDVWLECNLQIWNSKKFKVNRIDQLKWFKTNNIRHVLAFWTKSSAEGTLTEGVDFSFFSSLDSFKCWKQELFFHITLLLLGHSTDLLIHSKGTKHIPSKNNLLFLIQGHVDKCIKSYDKCTNSYNLSVFVQLLE